MGFLELNRMKKDRARILFGLPQKTAFKVTRQPKCKIRYRCLLKKIGYIPERGTNSIYYDDNTKRDLRREEYSSHEYGFVFVKL